MSNMANLLSSVNHQTHKYFDISKNVWCHRAVDLGEQPPEVSGDLEVLFVSFSFSRPVGRGVADEEMDVSPIFQSTDVHSSFPPTHVLYRTSCRPLFNLYFPAEFLLRFPCTNDFSRFPPSGTFDVFKKKTFFRGFLIFSLRNNI